MAALARHGILSAPVLDEKNAHFHGFLSCLDILHAVVVTSCAALTRGVVRGVVHARAEDVGCGTSSPRTSSTPGARRSEPRPTGGSCTKATATTRRCSTSSRTAFFPPRRPRRSPRVGASALRDDRAGGAAHLHAAGRPAGGCREQGPRRGFVGTSPDDRPRLRRRRRHRGASLHSDGGRVPPRRRVRARRGRGRGARRGHRVAARRFAVSLAQSGRVRLETRGRLAERAGLSGRRPERLLRVGGRVRVRGRTEPPGGARRARDDARARPRASAQS